MSRLKRSSKELEKAQQRATNLASIDVALDLGSGLTLPAYQTQITALQVKLNQHNNLLSEIDALANDITAGEKALAALSERMLDGVGVTYGKDSNQYEMAGAVRKSERKKAVRKTTSTPDNP
ncbi:MAG: hypothetical protein HY870_01415 [Chloroflexi bacterium]|nr:hypothetical protein [Chloroflexota bacterium]